MSRKKVLMVSDVGCDWHLPKEGKDILGELTQPVSLMVKVRIRLCFYCI